MVSMDTVERFPHLQTFIKRSLKTSFIRLPHLILFSGTRAGAYLQQSPWARRGFSNIAEGTMGLTLTRAAQWTTSSSDRGRLESTSTNEFLLKEILGFVEHLITKHPEEAEFVFLEPLQWSTTLETSDFKADNDSRNSSAQPHEKDSEDHSCLQFSPPTVSVHSFNQLSELLNLAGDKKLQEVQTCLEENRDPVAKILGLEFASNMKKEGNQVDILSLVDKLQEGNSVPEVDSKVKLFALLQNTDKQIFNKLIQGITEQVGLNPTSVKNEVELLKLWCTDREKRMLKSLRYTSDFEFSNGCRAPPWRQALGEICYLVIEPCDCETLYITCTTTGVFLNGGRKHEGDESGYEKTSDIYEDLVALLMTRSPHFAKNMNKQEQGPHRRLYEQQEKNVMASSKKKCKRSSRWNIFDILVLREEETNASKSSGGKKNLESEAKMKMKALSASPGHLSSQKTKTSTGAIFVEDFSDTSSDGEEEEQPQRHPDSNTDPASEYWQIQKLMKYLTEGDQTTTVLSLCALMDFDLMKETCQLAIQDSGGLQVLINLLDTDKARCKIGSLKILRKISHNMQIRQTIVDMGGLQGIVKILDSPRKDLKALAAETIATVAQSRRARRTVRRYDGIKKLVKLLDCIPTSAKLSANLGQDMEVVRCGILALWSCSKSTKNKVAIATTGAIPLLGRLLMSPDENMLVPVMGTLQECASEKNCRAAIKTEGIIKDFVKNLHRENDELQIYCATAIFKCAEDKKTCDLVRKYKGLQPLVSLLSKADNKQLLAATTGAIWKCSMSMENIAIFQEYKAPATLVGLLTDQPDEVLVNVVGSLGEFAQIPANRATIRKCGGIKPLVNLLIGTNRVLLVNAAKAIGACATDKDNMTIINQLDGVRLVWSLLKNPNADVQSSAAWALCSCLENAKDAGEMVRSIMGGLELIVKLLKSTNNEVLTSVCATIAKIAKDKENLGILTDLGVVPLLASLTKTTNDRLRRYLAEAIGRCCMWDPNRASFGETGAVAPLIKYLKSKDSSVHHFTAMALYQLSKNQHNIITMHKKGGVKPLIHFMGADDEELQEFAAACVENIRRLAMEKKKAH